MGKTGKGRKKAKEPDVTINQEQTNLDELLEKATCWASDFVGLLSTLNESFLPENVIDIYHNTNMHDPNDDEIKEVNVLMDIMTGVIVRDYFGCHNTIPACDKFFGDFWLHNYVAKNGIQITPRGIDFPPNYQQDKQFNIIKNRGLMALTTRSRQDRKEQSAPQVAYGAAPVITIRTFKMRQTTSASKSHEGHKAGVMKFSFQQSQRDGVAVKPFGLECTNRQMTSSIGHELSCHKLAITYSPGTYLPKKISNVQIRKPGVRKVMILFYKTGYFVNIGNATANGNHMNNIDMIYGFVKLCMIRRTPLQPMVMNTNESSVLPRLMRDNRKSRSSQHESGHYRVS